MLHHRYPVTGRYKDKGGPGLLLCMVGVGGVEGGARIRVINMQIAFSWLVNQPHATHLTGTSRQVNAGISVLGVCVVPLPSSSSPPFLLLVLLLPLLLFTISLPLIL